MSHFDNLDNIRQQFPILQEQVYGKRLAYFDNGATTHKPQSVIDAIVSYYKESNSNVHRGVHYLSQRATELMESSRQKIANFINAYTVEEIIFTKGTTDSINLIANGLSDVLLEEGDEVVVTEMEHHSNIVPWHMVCNKHKSKLKFIPFNDNGELILDTIPSLITDKTKIVSLTWVSNTLGTVNPVADIIHLIKSINSDIVIVIDAAQAIQHIPVDVQSLGADFIVASGHKMYGPTGIGILWGKYDLLDKMAPYQGGGSMIKSVSMSNITYATPPFKFEAGTPHIEGAIVLGAAIDFMNNIGMDTIHNIENEIMTYTLSQLQSLDKINLIGNAANRAGAISINIDGIHPFDIGELLDKQGVAVRTGHHCCQPIMEHFDIPGTLRISFGIYNNREDVDQLITALKKGIIMLS